MTALELTSEKEASAEMLEAAAGRVGKAKRFYADFELGDFVDAPDGALTYFHEVERRDARIAELVAELSELKKANSSQARRERAERVIEGAEATHAKLREGREPVAWMDATGTELHKIIQDYQKRDMIASGGRQAERAPNYSIALFTRPSEQAVTEADKSDDAVAELFVAAWAEADKAMRKFPQPNYVISKVAEEAGEVVKAAIHCAEGRETPANVIAEIRQTMAMLLRLYVEGDQVHGLPPLKAAMEAGR